MSDEQPPSIMSDDEYDAQYYALLPRFDAILQSSNNSSEITNELLSIVKSYPTTPCAEALAAAVLAHVQASPQQVDTLAVALKNLLDAPIAHSIVTDEYGSKPFHKVFRSQLNEVLTDRLDEAVRLDTFKHVVVAPTNPTLSAALFSASITKHQLFENYAPTYHFVREGLQLPNAMAEEERKEVVAVGTCLQLSVAGATIMEQWLENSDGQEAVLRALRGLKEREVVTTSGGLPLLDKTIEIAQGHFSQNISPDEAWGILFPTT